jgi:dCMP deaminase
MDEKEKEYWFELAKEEAKKSTCLRMKFGAYIVREGKMLGKGSNCPPYQACTSCMREENNIAPRTRAEYCHAVHAEQSAIINAMKNNGSIKGSTLIIAGYNPQTGTITYNRFSCTLCARLIAAAEIEGVITLTPGGLKYRSSREVYDEAYNVLKNIESNKIKNEKDLQNLLMKN